jgi:hypothetical protein
VPRGRLQELRIWVPPELYERVLRDAAVRRASLSRCVRDRLELCYEIEADWADALESVPPAGKAGAGTLRHKILDAMEERLAATLEHALRQQRRRRAAAGRRHGRDSGPREQSRNEARHQLRQEASFLSGRSAASPRQVAADGRVPRAVRVRPARRSSCPLIGVVEQFWRAIGVPAAQRSASVSLRARPEADRERGGTVTPSTAGWRSPGRGGAGARLSSARAQISRSPASISDARLIPVLRAMAPRSRERGSPAERAAEELVAALTD